MSSRRIYYQQHQNYKASSLDKTFIPIAKPLVSIDDC